jgi:hypothetical protein
LTSIAKTAERAGGAMLEIQARLSGFNSWSKSSARLRLGNRQPLAQSRKLEFLPLLLTYPGLYNFGAVVEEGAG